MSDDDDRILLQAAHIRLRRAAQNAGRALDRFALTLDPSRAGHEVERFIAAARDVTPPSLEVLRAGPSANDQALARRRRARGASGETEG